MYHTDTDFVLGKTDESLKKPVGEHQGASCRQRGCWCPGLSECWECLLFAVLVIKACTGRGSWVLTSPHLPIENVIRENQWGGVDIRRGGVPILRSNLICFGYSDGVVVGDEGKGLIEGNTIYGEDTFLGQGPAAQPTWGAQSPGVSSD